MVEICDEQMKVFMTKMHRLDNKLTEMQDSINVVKGEVKFTQILSKRQSANGLGVVGMTSGMALIVANPTYASESVMLFGIGLVIYIITLFWKPKKNPD
ncbi:hypothetical protein ACFLW9_03455 [Chloroflexota bacterium]